MKTFQWCFNFRAAFTDTLTLSVAERVALTKMRIVSEQWNANKFARFITVDACLHGIGSFGAGTDTRLWLKRRRGELAPDDVPIIHTQRVAYLRALISTQHQQLFYAIHSALGKRAAFKLPVFFFSCGRRTSQTAFVPFPLKVFAFWLKINSNLR